MRSRLHRGVARLTLRVCTPRATGTIFGWPAPRTSDVAEAVELLDASLDEKQRQIFTDEIVRLSHERGDPSGAGQRAVRIAGHARPGVG
jgi:hypothetical protein